MNAAAPVATLILSRADISGLMNLDSWLVGVESGFAAAGDGRAASPPPMAIKGSGGIFHAKGASIELDRLGTGP